MIKFCFGGYAMEKRHSYDKIRFLRIFTIYALVMFSLVVLALLIANKRTVVTVDGEQQPQSSSQIEYIYVTLGDTETPDVEDTQESDTVYTIREHMGKIGIFVEDGKLIRVIDVYVNTLPESDKRMLRQGFEIIGISRLNKIIQDYDG